MSKELAKYMVNKPFVELTLPNIYALGVKVLFQEYTGAPTGRLDVCTITGYKDGKTLLARRFCWLSNKFDTDLSQLGLKIAEATVPFYTMKVANG